MKICVYRQPDGSYLAIPLGPEDDQTPSRICWGHEPLVEFAVDSTNERIEYALALLIGNNSWLEKGSIGNVVVGILTKTFENGVKFGMERQKQLATEKSG